MIVTKTTKTTVPSMQSPTLSAATTTGLKIMTLHKEEIAMNPETETTTETTETELTAEALDELSNNKGED